MSECVSRPDRRGETEKRRERESGKRLYLNTAKCRVMDHCQRARREDQGGFCSEELAARDPLPPRRGSLECTSESYLAVIAITTCRGRTSLGNLLRHSVRRARARPRELFAVKLGERSPCRRLVSDVDFSYADFRSSLRGEVMKRFNSP